MTVTVYRLYDADENLLYVGQTADLKERLVQHAYTKDWYSDVRSVETQDFPGRTEACSAEKVAIRDELPRYNKVGLQAWYDEQKEARRKRQIHGDWVRRSFRIEPHLLAALQAEAGRRLVSINVLFNEAVVGWLEHEGLGDPLAPRTVEPRLKKGK